MRLNPFGTQIAAQISGMIFWLALSFPVFAGLSLDAQSLLSGNADDEVLDAVADSAGNLYVTGWTSSTSIGGQVVTIRGSRDVFVAKFDASGALRALQVFGGGDLTSTATDGNEQGTAIAIGPQGDIFVTGAVLGLNKSNGKGLPAAIVDQGCRTLSTTDAFLLVL